MRTVALSFLVLSVLGITAAGCGEPSEESAAAGAGGAGPALGEGLGGLAFNQCGVAAPLPVDTGQCTLVSAPAIANFDDYTGTNAADYGFSVGTARGGLVHVGDGGTGVVTTEMVPDESGSGYALQIANTNASNWGGLLMLYFSTPACLDAHGYSGVEFSVKGSSPTGRIGVTVGLLDTTPVADGGLCANATDCKDATTESTLPADPAVWTKVRVPWSAFTPGLGTGLSCVPLTGQNVVRLVIQPFMNYPPPDFMLQPGPYSLAVDNVAFY